VRVTYHGSAPHDSVAETLAQYDLFFFPTLGENFGHVIIEALLSGTPALVSDQTPWSRLPDRRAGWDLPLAEPERFREVLRKCIEMDDEEHRTWSAGAYALGREYLESGEAETRTAAMIRHAIAHNRRTDEPIGRIASP
jgi:glycosyltransferase involved in cell wall biosynthesis